MRRERPHRQRMLLLRAAALTLTAAAGIAAYAWAGTHQLVPGLDGCSYVRDAAARSACIERAIRADIDDTDIVASMARINETASGDPLVASRCHLALHPVGERIGIAAAREGRPLERIADRTPCDKGLVHGAVIGFAEHTDLPLADVVPRLCDIEQQQGPPCAHAVGHMLVRAVDQDEAGAEIADRCTVNSPELRASLTRPSRQVGAASIDECRRGGYMELALGTGQPRLEDWAADCARQDTPADVAAYCYAWLPPLASWHDERIGDVTRFCADDDLSPSRVDACIRGVAQLSTSAVECDDFPNGGLRRACGAMLAPSRD